MNFRGIRHTNATLLIFPNVDVAVVAARLGHAQISTTFNFYVHPLASHNRSAGIVLQNLLIDKNYYTYQLKLLISINSKIAFFKIINEGLCYFMSFIKACVPKLSPFTPKLHQGQKNKSLQSLATLVKFLIAGVRLELTTFGL